MRRLHIENVFELQLANHIASDADISKFT
jgi:hypothetical protein